eukprot:TRINITY_DN722_c0_g2_i1.p1 TRINITY_DN722_c0_g2~~TRINITY_DN722_c0_g2_i1.p1  ORF type:complete len:290 (+),score=55.48 TRINITY_DN722_c0_g2_i1:33-872(+)
MASPIETNPSPIPSCPRSKYYGRRVDQKVAIVTASTLGIGYAVAKRLALEGACVVISSRRQSNVDAAVASLKKETKSNRIIGRVCHVGNREHRAALFRFAIEQFGRLDILVSNAAVNPSFAGVTDTTEDQWDKIIDVNVKASFFLGIDAAKIMLSQPKASDGTVGNIIFISSIGGLTPSPMLGPYGISKTALLGVTKSLSTELASQQIRVNCVSPGVIQTKFSRALWEGEGNSTATMIPLQRIGHPDDIGAAVTFLASQDAAFMTGENVVVSGGVAPRL